MIHQRHRRALGVPAQWPADALSLAPGRNGIRTVDYAAAHRLPFWAGLDREAP